MPKINIKKSLRYVSSLLLFLDLNFFVTLVSS
uniref:Uncharacterized protein n=1 Tax=Arundo donax TaxID=35708 RepID=A0A0A9BBL3_ARUDO